MKTSTPHDAIAWMALVLSGGYIFAGCIPTIIGWVYDISNNYKFSLWDYSCYVYFCLLFPSALEPNKNKKTNSYILMTGKKKNKDIVNILTSGRLLM
ncbi:hypothetical protein ACPOM7_18495 [Peribacillus castrilensis]|uniref:Uncharacterized protein n=2 Tax=Peribacillus TaxID=2675229 RepID=A0AAN2PIE3_9BACI|nr:MULTISPECIES: hypothetical protein [Bacillaceae]MCF7622013.1 hypothetical protein [Peribacillus frigoritolerans]MCP1156103.1 hypothetical protein [Peribacillus frigoritolerans]MCT1391997.1 hypothetical protein [Peribacillus frigoritolerans]CEG33219.1 hypothetical protein BN1180_03391 [Peribacillus simplex]